MSGVHPMTFAAVSLCRPCNLPARPAAVPPPPRRLRVLCGTGLLLVLFACARGQITAYTSQSGFLTAAQAGGSFVFTDNLNSGSLSSGTATFPNGTVSGINIAFPNTNAVNTVDGSAYLRRRDDEHFRKFGLIERGIPRTAVAGLREEPQKSKLRLRHLEPAEPRRDVARR